MQEHPPLEALSKPNINPKIQGAKRPEGLNRKENTSKGKKRKSSFDSEQEELAYYKEYALWLEQEHDFTKKINALERRYAVKQFKAKNTK